jgi:hypothetical protein
MFTVCLDFKINTNFAAILKQVAALTRFFSVSMAAFVSKFLYLKSWFILPSPFFAWNPCPINNHAKGFGRYFLIPYGIVVLGCMTRVCSSTSFTFSFSPPEGEAVFSAACRKDAQDAR